MAFLRQCLFELRRRHESRGEPNSLADGASCLSKTFIDLGIEVPPEAPRVQAITGTAAPGFTRATHEPATGLARRQRAGHGHHVTGVLEK
jgi:hypothetical protein